MVGIPLVRTPLNCDLKLKFAQVYRVQQKQISDNLYSLPQVYLTLQTPVSDTVKKHFKNNIPSLF
jgi:hypothetical protein